jgi:hypothetical protein
LHTSKWKIKDARILHNYGRVLLLALVGLDNIGRQWFRPIFLEIVRRITTEQQRHQYTNKTQGVKFTGTKFVSHSAHMLSIVARTKIKGNEKELVNLT